MRRFDFATSYKIILFLLILSLARDSLYSLPEKRNIENVAILIVSAFNQQEPDLMRMNMITGEDLTYLKNVYLQSSEFTPEEKEAMDLSFQSFHQALTQLNQNLGLMFNRMLEQGRNQYGIQWRTVAYLKFGLGEESTLAGHASFDSFSVYFKYGKDIFKIDFTGLIQTRNRWRVAPGTFVLSRIEP